MPGLPPACCWARTAQWALLVRTGCGEENIFRGWGSGTIVNLKTPHPQNEGYLLALKRGFSEVERPTILFL